ncbi:Endochitinase 1 [Maudiozyma exigua]|uniref:Endochitinase 1 n=1 Tax=Maudiozyma exigua TaxID=34358 RepID=A0A9P7BA27_MAUEX|nr:Endochitinase 1 [Kazachstania exigua]
MWQYNDLPINGTTEEFDPIYGSAYCFDRRNKTFVGYDNYQSVQMKSEYAWRNDLAGLFMWESLGDRGITKKESLMEVFVKDIRYQLKPTWSIFAEQKMIEYYVSKYPTDGYLTKYLQYLLQHLNSEGQLI